MIRIKKEAIAAFGALLLLIGFTWNEKNNQLIISTDDPGISLHLDEANSELKISSSAKPIVNKILLYWTTYYNQTDFTFGMGQEPFIKAGCPINNCWATADRSFLNKSEGVLFHAGNYRANDLPDVRLPSQRYIFLLFETLPGSAGLPFFSQTKNYFNWTMSHRRDADVYVGKPYGALRRKVIGPSQLPAALTPGKKLKHAKEILLIEGGRNKLEKHPQMVNRTKLVAWFNSHCPTHSQREDYVAKLSQYIQVDIYGQCGKMQCLPRNSPECETLLDGYKFYLAFENSLCPDYVTEKFYRALDKGVVPIVYGGADYSDYAPSHSYINIADFKSPKELADYLQLLDNNDALYLKYFEWRKDWEVVRRPLDGWCDLCAKLNGEEPAKSYPDMAQWWFDDVSCLPGSTFIKQTVA